MIIYLLVLLFCYHVEAAIWVAHTGLPVRIEKDNFSALCIIENVTSFNESNTFQWSNGSNIVPKAGRYVITLHQLAGPTPLDIVSGNLSNLGNWSMLLNMNSSNLALYSKSSVCARITILAVQKEDVGNLMCANSSVIAVDSFAYVEFKQVKSALQGDDYRLKCDAYGSPQPQGLKWYKNGEPLVTDDRLNYELNTTLNTTLRFTPIEFTDSGDYTCYAWNKYGVSENATTILKVKDRWAALWPFLGIVAEVIVLCTVILLYERRQQAKLAAEEREEDEKDNATLMNDGTAANTGDKDDHDVAVGNGDDVRQRSIIKS